MADQPKAKDAFAELMRMSSTRERASSAANKAVKPAKATVGSSMQSSIDVDDFNDDFLSNISTSDLDIIEKRARVASNRLQAPLPPSQPQKCNRPPQQASKLSINFIQKPVSARPAAGPGFKSQLMKDARSEHRMQLQERKRNEVIGGAAQKLPTPSALGTGLGAYQGERRTIHQIESSGSSASDSSSDEEHKGIAGLVRRQKSPKRTAKALLPERRPIKILGAPLAEIVRQREDKRASQHAIKERLRPDLNPVYRYVLAWNPDHTGPMAPHPPKHFAGLSSLSHVPMTFTSSKHYEQVMLPLFLQELWGQCIKDTPTSLPVPVEISTRTYEDDFLDIELAVQGNLPVDFYVNDSDVVVLRRSATRPVFAKVQGFRRKFKDVALKVRILVMTDQKELAGRSRWHLQKHLS